MNSRNSFKASIATLALFAICCVPATAQKVDVRYDPISKTVNLDADHANVRDLVQRLLSTASVTRYHMDPRIDAPVTLTLRNTPFDRALQTTLARAGAEYDYAEGVLRIFPVGERPGRGRPGSSVPQALLARVTIHMVDAPISSVVTVLSRNTAIPINVVRAIPADLSVTINAVNEPLWDVLQRIARQTGLRVEATGDREATFLPRIAAPDGGACAHCRYELKREWKFCPMCGDRINR
jgi:type II secretory pathway component GspD/PulD (secretin)